MPEISRFYGIVIRMFFNEHAPPHFHVEYGEHQAVIHIHTLALKEGKLPTRALALVLDWAQLHQHELLADWELCQQHQQPQPVSPLE